MQAAQDKAFTAITYGRASSATVERNRTGGPSGIIAKEPRIVHNGDGVEVLKSRMGEEALAKAFDEVEFHLGRMDRQGVETSVLSLLGSFCWVESQPLDVSGPLCRKVRAPWPPFWDWRIPTWRRRASRRRKARS